MSGTAGRLAPLLLPRRRLREFDIFAWLKKRFVDWADRCLKREIERLHAENLRLKAEVLKATGEPRIRLTPEEHRELESLRQTIDPEAIKQISVLSDAE